MHGYKPPAAHWSLISCMFTHGKFVKLLGTLKCTKNKEHVSMIKHSESLMYIFTIVTTIILSYCFTAQHMQVENFINLHVPDYINFCGLVRLNIHLSLIHI